jgi:hypothetical protein
MHTSCALRVALANVEFAGAKLDLAVLRKE